MPEFRLLRGGLQDRFLSSRKKIQIYGGGFGNGKTTALVMRALGIAEDYPGANILMARSTYPKLNDTLRKEFLKWCPKDWIKSFPMSVNASNTCTLTNGTVLNFRYIAQQGKNEEATTSNLLSATYDLIVVDQMEDPEITHKDFLDLVGRLRGSASYRGEDPTMPRTGPRWMEIAVNPTRNWFYQEIVKPYHDYIQRGEVSEKLLCIRDPETNEPVLDAQGNVQLLLDLVEGSTYENRHNLEGDFIQMMESSYQGQMKDRFLLGKWAAYEGLIYPMFDEQVHMVDESYMKKYLDSLIEHEYDIEWLEGYDYGIAKPSCYLLAFIDPLGFVHTVDGFYKAEYDLEDQWPKIKEIRNKWGAPDDGIIEAEPDIFRRKGGKNTGTTVADLFFTEGGILVRRAANDILHGITKVASYLMPRERFQNPYTLEMGAPALYYNSKLTWVSKEMGGYFWRKNSVTGAREDVPAESEDHSLDTTKYMFTKLPDASKLKPKLTKNVPLYMLWNEREVKEGARSRRHG